MSEEIGYSWKQVYHSCGVSTRFEPEVNGFDLEDRVEDPRVTKRF